jgi:hypothetical protein
VVELAQGQPDHLLVEWDTQLAPDYSGQFLDCSPSITMLPDASGGFVQAMRFVTGQVIDEHFVLDGMG